MVPGRELKTGAASQDNDGSDREHYGLANYRFGEAAFLIERGRVGIPTLTDLLADILADKRIEISPLTWGIFERSFTTAGLNILELHDRFIVGTALHLQDLRNTVEIVTRDEKIVGAGVLPVIW